MGREDWDGESCYYGGFCGGDPRCFKPDPECTTAEEFDRWRLDCAAADRVQVGKPNEPAASGFVTYPDGSVAHQQRIMYGLGVNHDQPGPWVAWAQEFEERRRKLEQEGR